MTVELDGSERRLLDGAAGPGPALAMRMVVGMAESMGAEGLIPISRAHVDGCLYHGRASLDFARRLLEGGAKAVVPTTLNVSSLDLLHPHFYRGTPETAVAARELMDTYVAMGCRPTWTCAPYQLSDRPVFGEQIAWGESNAIVFANSVIGARTNRYGDFIDIAAAVTGRVPAAGLHLDEGRAGGVVVDVSALSPAVLESDVLYPVLGHFIGRRTADLIPVIVGLPTCDEDRLKALGAAAASSGAVAMFHAVGVTPEAPDLKTALKGDDAAVVEVDHVQVEAAWRELSTTASGRLDAVSLGTPHFSLDQFERLVALVAGRRVVIDTYVNTGREVLAAVKERGWLEELEGAGVQMVTDTCTYITPILRPEVRMVMTDSAKWAYYAPGKLGVEVVFGSLEECVRSAMAGELVRDDQLWA